MIKPYPKHYVAYTVEGKRKRIWVINFESRRILEMRERGCGTESNDGKKEGKHSKKLVIHIFVVGKLKVSLEIGAWMAEFG